MESKRYQKTLFQEEIFHFARVQSSLVFDEVVCRLLLVMVRRGRFGRLGRWFLLDEQRGRRQRGRSAAARRRGGAVFPDRLKITLQIVDPASATAAAANT